MYKFYDNISLKDLEHNRYIVIYKNRSIYIKVLMTFAKIGKFFNMKCFMI